jgi:uncharacterized glyoxalase superfamily protein PhnB
MTDPFDVLRLPTTPLAPDPEFAARLRGELARALDEGDDRGAEMTTTDTSTASTTSATPVATGRPTLSPYLAVSDGRRAVEWYVQVFGGVLGETVEMPDGRLGHAEIRIGNATLMLADEFPEIGHASPETRGGTTVTVVIDVADVDDVTRTAKSAGATVESEPADQPYGFRGATIVDPFGHRWIIEAPLPATSATTPAAEPAPAAHDEPATGPGDIVYVTWRVQDEQRTAAFFGELLGWTFTPGHVEHGLQVHGANILGGLWGGGEHSQVDAKLMYEVADIADAVATIRALGGTATEPELQPYGWSSECTDDQGMEFWVTAPAES